MFYKGGVVISDKFYHLKFICFCSFQRKKREIWEFGKWERGGPLFPKVNVKILTKFLLFGENQKCY